MANSEALSAVCEDYAISKYASAQDARLAMLGEIANLREVKAELLEVSAAKHTPGPVASLEISLRIGQRVRHHDFHGKRVTGVVRGLSVDSENGLCADIALDEAIVIPPLNDEDREIRIYHQHVPAHELAPFDEREELIAALLGVAQRCEQRLAAEKWRTDGPREALAPEAVLLLDLRAAIEKATGAAA